MTGKQRMLYVCESYEDAVAYSQGKSASTIHENKHPNHRGDWCFYGNKTQDKILSAQDKEDWLNFGYKQYLKDCIRPTEMVIFGDSNAEKY